MLFIGRFWESCSIWKNYVLITLYSSTSDNFSFSVELYNAMFDKDISTLNYFFKIHNDYHIFTDDIYLYHQIYKNIQIND